MTMKDLDVSDPSKLNNDQLKYARDRYLITDDQFEENFSYADDNTGEPKPLEHMNGNELREKVAEMGLNIDDMHPKPKNKAELIAVIRDHEAAAAAATVTA